MDMVGIAECAARECVRQNVGLDRLSLLIASYAVLACKSGDLKPNFAQYIAGCIEPDNKGQFRKTPVTFANGGSSANWQDIPRQWQILFDNQPSDEISSTNWLRHLLWVHPFSDGNGRLAWLLWNYYSGDMSHALPLPDFGW